MFAKIKGAIDNISSQIFEHKLDVLIGAGSVLLLLVFYVWFISMKADITHNRRAKNLKKQEKHLFSQEN